MIAELPFNRELTTGALDPARFRHYIEQDILYLRRYSRALALAAGKSPGDDTVDFFTKSAQAAIAVERSMHAGFLDRFDISAEALRHARMSPTCQAYTDFLLATVYDQPFGVGVAAILPCFWVYWEVGQSIAAAAAETLDSNPYRAWIETYADPGFGEAVEQVKRIADEAANVASQAERNAMIGAFARSTEYELLFWQGAYDQEQWPTHELCPDG